MICPHCGEELTPVEGQKYCSYCGGNLETGPLDPEITAAKDNPRFSADFNRPKRPGAYCPWEDQEELGFFPAITQTAQQSLLKPREFFDKIPINGGYVQPLLYALIVATLGEMVGILWTFSLDSSLMEKLNAFGNVAALVAVITPLFVFIRVVLTAVFFHVSLYLLGGVNENFEATFRVSCYASAPELCSIFPVVGGIIGMIWKFYITVVGLESVHRIEWWRASLAVLLPFVLCCAAMAGGFYLMLTSLGVASG